EDAFREYGYREGLIYGSNEELEKFEGTWIGEKITKFYRQLTPDNFYKISKEFRLDYVIIESDFAESFRNFSPLFSNGKMNIYATRQFELLDKI
ncbi:MAG: hypothetical protein KAK04_23895, partial [Cyclobacteriaceae bacterium]|nr:hypothetical protein [Cyclobacteriaceae bacterium]